MTIEELALRSRVSNKTLSKQEKSEGLVLRRSALSLLIHVLDQASPIDAATVAELTRLAGLADVAGLVPDQDKASAVYVQAAALGRLASTLDSDQEREALYTLFDLCEKYGGTTILDCLRGVSAALAVAMPAAVADAKPKPDDVQNVRVHHPPVQREGYVEQVIEDLAVRVKPVAAPAKRKAAGG